jgi:hypothetical protein
MIDELGESVLVRAMEFRRLHPLSCAQDIYKNLHQSFHGSEHAISERDITLQALTAEWNSLTDEDARACPFLCEPIFLSGITPPLFIIHLAPAKVAGVDPARIFHAFIDSSRNFPKFYPDPDSPLHDRFVSGWNQIGIGIKLGRIELPPDEYASLTAAAEKSGWEAMHHSDRFRQAYKPHYRLSMVPMGPH